MKRLIPLFAILALLIPSTLFAEEDIADKAIAVWRLIKDAENDTAAGNGSAAYQKYKAASKILNEIKTTDPKWNPHLIEFRLRDCAEHMAELEKKGAHLPPKTETPEAAGEAKSQLEKLRHELEKSRASQGDLEMRLRAAETALQNIPAPDNKQLEAVKAEKLALETQLVESQHKIADLQSRITNPAAVQAQLESLSKELSRTQESLESANRLNAQRDAELKKAQDALKEALKKSEEKLDALAKEKAEVEKQLKDALAQIKDLEARTTPSQAETEELQAQLKKVEEEKTALEKKLADAEKALRDAKEELTAKASSSPVGGAIAALEARVKKMEADAAAAAARVAALFQEKKTLESQLNDSQQALTEARQKIAEYVATQQQLAEQNKNKTLIESRLAEAQQRIQQLETAQTTAFSQRDEIQGEFIQIKTQLADAQKQSESYKISLAETTAQLERTQKELAEATAAANATTKSPANTRANFVGGGNASASNPSRLTLLQQENQTLRVLAQKKKVEAAQFEHQLKQLQQSLATREAEMRKVAESRPAPSPIKNRTSGETVDEAIARLPESLRPALKQADELAAREDWKGAGAIYEDILRSYPNNLLALGNLGVVRLRQNQLNEAEKLLRRASTLVPDDAFSRSALGMVLYEKGSLDDALAELSHAIVLDGKNAENFNFRGVAFSKKGWQQAAEAELRKALELKPNYTDAHYNLATVYTREKPAAMALARFHYKKALSLGLKPDVEFEKKLGLLTPALEPEPPVPPADSSMSTPSVPSAPPVSQP